MRRRNMTLGAVLSIALIAGVAWHGERNHAVPRPPPPRARTVELDPLPPVEPDSAANMDSDDEKPRPKAAVAPMQPDMVAAMPPVYAFTQPVEPPRPATDIQDGATIPQDRSILGPNAQTYHLSQLDRVPIVRYQARPE